MKLRYLLLCSFLVVACSPPRVPPPATVQSHFSEGENFFQKGLYEEAIASWGKVRESYFSPEMTTLAEMKIAEAHFMAEQYVEAAAAYEDFLKQHPDHEKIPEIMFNLGMSYHHQMLDADRDQTATRNALSAFESLAKRFPGHPKAKEVPPFIRASVDRLAAHELYVADFYLRTARPQSAIRRIEDLFRKYPDYPERDRAYFILGRSLLKDGQTKEARTVFNTLYRNFPQSEYIAPAQKILDKEL